MTLIALAIVIHVLSVVWWIGGLAFVTTVVLPGLSAGQLSDPGSAFQAIEHRFAPQARVAVVLVGLSGLYLLARLDLWNNFAQARFWWLDAMAAFWLLFVLLLFVIEPKRLLKRLSQADADGHQRWQRMLRLHRVLLVLALVVVAGAVAGSHGL